MWYGKKRAIISLVAAVLGATAQAETTFDPLGLWGSSADNHSNTATQQDLREYRLPTANDNLSDEEFQQVKQRLSSRDKPVDPRSLAGLKPFPDKADYTMTLASPDMARSALLAESARLKNAPTSSVYVPSNVTIRKGEKGEHVRLLGRALRDLGYLQSSPTARYTTDLENAIKAFQSDNGLLADGVAGNQTFAIINRSDSFRKKAIDYTLTKDLQRVPTEARAIVVNIAAQQLRAYESGKLVLTSKVIVGKDQYFTPEFMDTIDSITVNPTWNVPKGISERTFRGEKVAVTAGPDNPLGKLRFNMYNKYTIYLHHTNSPNLFNLSQRALSAGCVRVEKAYDLAMWIIGDTWYSSGIDALLQTNKTKDYPLRTKIPVYIEYRPAEVLINGRIKIWNDPYGRLAQESTGTYSGAQSSSNAGSFPGQGPSFAQDNTSQGNPAY